MPFLRGVYAQATRAVDVSKLSRWASFNLSQIQDASSRKAFAERDDVKIIDPDVELDFREAESLAGCHQASNHSCLSFREAYQSP